MEQLKRLRTEKGLSQARLAARAEVDPSTVNQIERGAREASPATLRKLAHALDVSLFELLEDDSPKVQSPLPLDVGNGGSGQLPKANRSSLEQLLKAAGVKTRWFVIPHEEWLEAFRGQGTTEAARKLVDIAVQMEKEFGELVSLIHFGPPNHLGNPTLARGYVDIWRQAAQRRIRTYLALERLESDQDAPEDLRDQAQMILQSMRETSDKEFDRLLPSPQERTAGRSYV